MPGTKEGGRKAAAKNKLKDQHYMNLYGMTFYEWIGSQGGKESRGGGFVDERVGKDGLTGRQRASIAGRKGGLASRKTKVQDEELQS